MLRRFLIALLTISSIACQLRADESLRPVRSAFMLEAGSSHQLDSYLSPLKYTGWHTAFTYERNQAMKFSPEHWRQQLMLGVEINNAQNPARNASMLYGNLAASWSMSRLWTLPGRLRVMAGGMVDGNLGGMYNQRNSNNPASLKADISLGVKASLGWDFKLKKLPIELRWQSSMPIIGAFFSPEYDELYYEIYLGNTHGLAHVGVPWTLFRWDNLVTADLALGTSSLRLGFRSQVYSTEANHITTRNFSYALVIGVVTDWLSVSPRKHLPDNSQQIEWAY
jgi:hypothetical protein